MAVTLIQLYLSVIPGGECVILEDNTMPSEDELDDSSCSPGGNNNPFHVVRPNGIQFVSFEICTYYLFSSLSYDNLQPLLVIQSHEMCTWHWIFDAGRVCVITNSFKSRI